MPFSIFGLDPKLVKAVENLGFEQPTPIQRLAIPPLMEGRDVLATAVTGSGKTAAFLLPIMHRLLQQPRGTTRVLVLAPTRELAAQICEHMGQLGRLTGLKGTAVFGGVGMGPQENAFRKGHDIIVATPGRLMDHMQYGYAKLAGLEVLVLDEADRMLDMGFLPDIKRILSKLPQKRQTLLFSATLPLPIVELAGTMLKEPASLNVERKAAPAVGITHVAYPVPHELKSKLLLRLLERAESKSVLAFTRTKHRANRLADFLENRGVSTARIHGGRSQAQRTEALAGFKRGKFRVLVATDIAARGIDVEDLGLVVNFDVPGMPDDYIHRVGRTARAEATGDAYTFVSPGEEGDLRGIEKHIGKRLPRQRVEGFDYDAKPEERFEVPIAERLVTIRARRAEERLRAKANAERRAAKQSPAQAKTGKAPARREAPARHEDVRSGPPSRRDESRSGSPAFKPRVPRQHEHLTRLADAYKTQQSPAPARLDDTIGGGGMQPPRRKVEDDNRGNVTRGVTDRPPQREVDGNRVTSHGASERDARRDKGGRPWEKRGPRNDRKFPSSGTSQHGAAGTRDGAGGHTEHENRRRPQGEHASQTPKPAPAYYPKPGNHPSVKPKGGHRES